MKKLFLFALSSTLLLSSCGTYTGSGAYAGGSIGSILGSAIGGLAGGPRGSDMGTIIGMAGGAAVGAVLGSQADQASSQCQNSSRERPSSYHSPYGDGRASSSYGTHPDYSSRNSSADDTAIFDSSNSGDDRLYDFDGKDYTGNYSARQPTTSVPSATIDEIGENLTYSPSLEIVNARFVDSNENNALDRNESCKIIFEIVNRGKTVVYDVVPTVVETTGNKHIFISPSIHVEKIAPGLGVRYTAMVKADNRLKDGTARFCVSVVYGDKSISKVNEFNIPTRK